IARSAVVLEGAPRLVVLARRGTAPVLAWEAVAGLAGDEEGLRFRSRVYADAHSGELIDAFTLLRQALNRRILDSNNACWNGSGAVPGAVVLTEGGNTAGVIAPAVNAYNAFGNVYHYFNNAFGIDSYDDAGSQLRSYVRLRLNLGGGCTGANAAWGNGTMYLGIGDARHNDMSTEPDVTYHEFGHGVTDVTSNLTYAHESGGLNEAASDIYAAAVEAWINTVPGGAASAATPIAYRQNADVWTIGEGLRLDGTPFRTMRDPATEDDLDRYSQYVAQFGNCRNPSSATNDNCGVHSSSGIANLAFYLLTNGGTHPRGATNINVGAIPFDRAIRYFFEVNQLRAVGANATFSQMRNAMQARARANGAVGLCDEVRISQAWAAVEVNGVAPQNPNACGGGAANQNPVAAFTTTTNGLTVSVNGGGSNDPDGAIASYAWNFGDGSTGSGSNASRTYAAAGTYTVTLTVTDNQGATNTTTRSVTVTAGGNAQCPGDAFSGTFAGSTGQSQFQPTGGSYTTTASGAHTVCLSGPAGTDFDVYLQKRGASGTWSTVAQSRGSTSTERIAYTGTAGTYRVRVTNFSGAGAYTGTLRKP
ncbi:MAG TPA: M4 family metallopeptidase, partial [Tahibacter sp.]|nr:M4 family metallopeptidase [Tahibacter sp.]